MARSYVGTRLWQAARRHTLHEATQKERGDMAEAEIGVIGTTADSSPLDDATETVIDTPYGFPSSPISIGLVGDKRVAYIARRGEDGQISPPRIPNRANLWALR